MFSSIYDVVMSYLFDTEFFLYDTTVLFAFDEPPVYEITADELHLYEDIASPIQTDEVMMYYDDDAEYATPASGVIRWDTPYYDLDTDKHEDEDEESRYAGVLTPRRLVF